jgi:hypothetical protein
MSKLDIVRGAINELSKKTLGNYVRRAGNHRVDLEKDATRISQAGDAMAGVNHVRGTTPGENDVNRAARRALGNQETRIRNKSNDRATGIHRALKRLTKEEFEGPDTGPEFEFEPLELMEANDVSQLQQKRAHHDIMGQTHAYAARLHMDKSLQAMDDHPEMASWHEAQADKHYARGNRHDQAWERAHSLISKANEEPTMTAKEETEIAEGRGRPRKDGSAKAEEDAGDSNIISQLHKTVSLRGSGHQVKFDDGSSHHIPYDTARHAITKHGLVHPMHRLKYQKALGASKASFDQAVRS